jgi:hypothetical protein
MIDPNANRPRLADGRNLNIRLGAPEIHNDRDHFDTAGVKGQTSKIAKPPTINLVRTGDAQKSFDLYTNMI